MKKIYKVLIFMILCIAVMSIKTTVNAASLSITASKQKLNIGEKATITVSSDSTGSVSISANGGTLEGDKTIWVEKNSQSGITITSSKAGKVTVTATPTDGTLSYNYKDETVTAKYVTVEFIDNTVKEPTNNNTSNENSNTTSNTNNNNNQASNEKKETTDNSKENEKNNATTENQKTNSTSQTTVVTPKSSNANLSDLGIRPNDFKGFKPNITSYDVTVPNDVTKIEVYSKTQDEKAKTSVKGNRNLEVGKNVFEITVKAEDGNTKVYTINVTREEAEKKEENQPETNNNTTKEENQTSNEIAQTTTIETVSPDLKKIEIVGYTISPAFNANIYEYKLEVPQDVSSLEVKTEAGNTNVQVDVAGNKDLKDGENVVTIVCTNKETKKISTYQVIVNKKIAENPHADAINEAMKKRNLIIKVGIGIIIVLIILCIIVFKKGNDEVDKNIEEKPKSRKRREFKEESEEKSSEEFRQLLENKKSRKENSDTETEIVRQVAKNKVDPEEMKNKKHRTYTDEEIEEIRRKRIAERESKERQARQSVNNSYSNEELPKSLQKESSQEFSMMNADKIQRARGMEFDEKLERIRRERYNNKKGGKHF